ncbi:MAG: LAGLIDADG family homing endonuclease [Promethearchaeota archaeon]
MKENIQNSKFRKVNILTNKIEPPKTKPESKPINKIEQHVLEPDYIPKNKIRPPKHQINYKTRNKIELPKVKPDYKSINKIERHTLEPDYTPKNKIRQPKLQTNYKTRNKIILELKPDSEKIEEKSYGKDKPINFVKLRNSSELAEMVCLGLGDGSIPKNESRFRVTLNETEEIQYTKHVKSLMQKLFNKTPSIYKPKKANAVKLTISNKTTVKKLIDKGLKSGDKKVNQVCVPKWIKDNKKFQKDGLRGLVDTDGSIHVHKSTGRIRVKFKNASLPLVKDFKEMCKLNDVKTSKIYPVQGKNTYEIEIETKKDVCRFLYKIQPRKWKYRAQMLGLVLISISDPHKRKKIDDEIFKLYPDKKVHYSDVYRDILKNLCVIQEYDVSKKAIIKKIEEALTYNLNYTGLTREKMKELNIYGNRLVNDLRNYLS